MNKMTMLKYLIILIIFMSTMITINSSSWINAWIGMEINLLMFIPMMMNKFKKMKISNSMMIYFIIQASASSMMLIMIISYKTNLNLIKINPIMMIIHLSLLMKLGASPFHWWIPKMVINMSWMNCFILLTWQKISPMFLIMMSNNLNMMIYLSSLLTILMSTLMGLNQTSIKLILFYSSLNHLSWMLMIMMMNPNIMMNYYSMYFLMMMVVCLYFNNQNFNYLNQMYKNNNNNNINTKIFFLLSLMSLTGMPPMLGFFPKLMILMTMLNNYMFFESLYFIMMTSISLLYYMNMLTPMFIFNKNLNYWNNKSNPMYLNKSFTSILLINSLMLMTIISNLNNNSFL